MKQKLLTLFVLLVSAMTAFADAEGSGTSKGNKDINKDGVPYTYQFIEESGNVTFTITPNTEGVIGYVATNIDDESHLPGYDYEVRNTTRTWTGLDAGTVIKVKCWFDIAGGRSYTDEITYTVATVATHDTEKPVMAKAEATNIFDTKATLTLNASDNRNGTLTYKVTIGKNSYTTTGAAGKDATIDITDLTAETQYDFSVTATDMAGNVSDAKTGTFTTAKALTLTAPDAPTVAANKVISVLSGAYTAATTWGFGTWRQATVAENVTVDGAPMIHLSKFNYIGLDYFSNQLDLSGMTHMHFDVLPITMTGALGVTPILVSGAPKERSTKVGDANTFKAQQWNAVDIALSDFGLDFINNKVFQVKFDQGNSATDELYIANIYFYNNSVGEQTLGSIKLGSTLAIGTTLTTTVQAIASDGTAFVGDVTYTISDGATLTREGNTLTITGTDGTYTLTATSGQYVATATIQLITVTSTTAPTEKAEDVLAYYCDTYGMKLGASGLAISDKAWNWHYTDYSEITLAENDKAILVSGVGTWGLNLGEKNLTGYNKVCADIYSIEEIPYKFVWENTSITKSGTLTKGWNHLEIPLGTTPPDKATWLQFYIGTEGTHNYTVVFDNIYATKKELSFHIDTKSNEKGNIAEVVGPVTAANVKQINNVDAMNIDLQGVSSIEEGVTLQPLRKNAIIVISGTYKEETIDEKKVCTTTADSKFDAIKEMKNVVVLAADGYYHPLKQLEFVDIPGEPLWMGGLRDLNDFISTGNTGWKVTRTIKAHTHATVCVINAIDKIPANLRAWEAVGYDETTGIQFNKANVIGGNFPYVVRNATDEDTDLSFTGTNDLNLKSWVGTDAAVKKQVGKTNIYFCGNWKEALVTDGSQWIIKNEGVNASIVKAAGVKISPFRAYFTGIPEGASAKLNFNDEETTGITNVNAAESNDGTLYNLAGQKVNAAYKGIVIKNGKKYLVK